MSYRPSWRPRYAKTVLAAAILASPCGMCLAEPQNQPALQITSPTNNAVVNPGQTVSVGVTSPNNTPFTQVFVITDRPMNTTATAASVPAQLSLAIPQKIALGKHLLTAVGKPTSGGQLQYSAPITIDVERTDLPTRLRADPNQILFRSAGETSPLRILANFSDGSSFVVTESTNVAFQSSNSNVATVSINGIVTAVAQGTVSITATYTIGTQNISVSVPVSVPAPVTTSTPTTLNFNNQNVGTSSVPQTLTIANVSSNNSLGLGPLSVTGDFSETDNCGTSSPLTAGGCGYWPRSSRARPCWIPVLSPTTSSLC